MGSLLDGGFRPPQFSEESAWLPCWFQHQNVQPLHDEKDHRFMNKCPREDTIMSLEDGDRYKSCHLFLSGEDIPSASLCPSSANVGSFHLHLSSDGITQDFYSSGLGTFKSGNTGSDHVVLNQKNEFSASQKVRGTRSTINHDAYDTKSLPLTSQNGKLEHACHHSSKGNNNIKTNNQNNIKKHNISEISKAVELSNAAAEALIMHDMVKSSPSTKDLSSAAILEIALRVKKARLEFLEDIPYFSEENIDENESISDFDEADMADAFEDVGLTFCNSDDVSQVKETPNLETHPLNLFPLDTFTGREPTNIIDMDNQKINNLSNEIVDFDGKRMLEDDPISDLTTSVKVPHNDTGLQWSMVEKYNIPAGTEGLCLGLENMTPPGEKAKEICSRQDGESENDERDDEIHSYGAGRFQSRWLGGWMEKKETHACETIVHRNPKIIPKLLVGETSYLSESADIAPDENSHFQIQDKVSQIASQQSIIFKGLDNNLADEALIFSPNTPIPSFSSLADPLCSVVPCSLSSENISLSKINDPNIVEDTEELLRPASEHFNNNSIAEFVKIIGEGFRATICRNLTSLRKYSTRSPKCNTFMENIRNHGNPLVTSPNISKFISIEKSLYEREMEENQETLDQIRQDEYETQAHIEKKKCSPIILNRGKRHRLVACKEVDKGKISEKSHNPEIRARKRVHFSDVHKKSLYPECSPARAGKTIKKPNVERAKKIQSPHKNAKKLVLRNIEFLLTGFPLQKEREIKNIIRKHDGTVLPGIPSSNSRGRRISRSSGQYHPVVLCPHKLETTEFLYGCVVNAFILSVDWLTDSVKAGSALAPARYTVISNHVDERSVKRPFRRNKHNYIFEGIGIMLHGKHSFCTRLAIVIKHGGGKVFKTLQLMVQNLDAKNISSGIIVAEDERSVSRHLKHCASEGNIHTMAASWIINSLHLGKLLPFNANIHSSCLPKIRTFDYPDSAAFSEEI